MLSGVLVRHWMLLDVGSHGGKTNAGERPPRRNTQEKYLRPGASLRFSSSLFTPPRLHRHQHHRDDRSYFDQDLRQHRNNETTN
jgi:hypothetical protein